MGFLDIFISVVLIIGGVLGLFRAITGRLEEDSLG